MSKKKPFKSFVPTSPEMEAAMEELVKADKFIVISEYAGEFNGKIGRWNNIHHEWGGPRTTSDELNTWAYVMKEKADHQDQLRDILDESGIEGA